MKHPYGLTDSQMQIVLTAANGLPTEKRNTFLQRVAAQLQHNNYVDDAVKHALTGLVHERASAAV